MSRLKDWIARVHAVDRPLAAWLRGLAGAQTEDGQVTFIWFAEAHQTQGKRREGDIRKHLGKASDWPIVHLTMGEYISQDPMLAEARELGAKIKFT